MNGLSYEKHESSPSFVMELRTGYVMIEEQQYETGNTLFLCKKKVEKMSQLDNEFRLQFLDEMSLVGEALDLAFQPDAMKYELMETGQLCWRLIARMNNDTPKTKSGDTSLHETMDQKSKKRSSKQLKEWKKRLKEQLEIVLKEREDSMELTKMVPRWMK